MAEGRVALLQETCAYTNAPPRGCRNEKKKLGVSNPPYDGGWWVTDGGWCVTDGGWWVANGGWWVTNGGWWVATKHQRVDAIVKKRGGVSVLMAPPDTTTSFTVCLTESAITT